MKSDELIHLLVNDKTSNWSLQSTLAIAAVAGTVAAGTVFFAAIGFRPDIAAAVESVRFLFKFVVTISLAATAIAAALTMARPGADFKSAGTALLLAPILLLCAVGLELVIVPHAQWATVLVGHNSRFCLTLIPLLSIGPLVCFLAALRHGAPSHPGRAGAIGGSPQAALLQPSTQQTATMTVRCLWRHGIRSQHSSSARRAISPAEGS